MSDEPNELEAVFRFFLSGDETAIVGRVVTNPVAYLRAEKDLAFYLHQYRFVVIDQFSPKPGLVVLNTEEIVRAVLDDRIPPVLPETLLPTASGKWPV